MYVKKLTAEKFLYSWKSQNGEVVLALPSDEPGKRSEIKRSENKISGPPLANTLELLLIQVTADFCISR